MSDNPIVKALGRAKICEGLDSKLLEAFSGVFRELEAETGTLFIQHDSQSKDVFIIVSGIVEVEIPVVGKQTNSSLARLKPGESVGEFALLRDARRTATARAVNGVKLIAASSDDVLKLFDVYPALGYCVCRNLGRILADRLTDTNMQLRSALSRS